MTKALATLALMSLSAPALAEDFTSFERSQSGTELAPYLQCAPYARQTSGIQIYGDARSWWEQAQGNYATGRTPREGAVMTFTPHRAMQLGHVATVSRVIDSRRVLLDHANWSPVNGRRGQVEKDVLAVDVSAANDWSEVRVWYAPLGDLGTTAWPVTGFIYADTASKPAKGIAQSIQPARKETSQRFMKAFADFAN